VALDNAMDLAALRWGDHVIVPEGSNAEKKP
jgi:hypothetical protein